MPYLVLRSIVLSEKYSSGLNVTPALSLKLTQYFWAEIFSTLKKINKNIEKNIRDLK
jgi:hypothetical protein